MAKIEIAHQFNGLHGTFEQKTELYTIRLTVIGDIINGFVGNIDSNVLEKNLKSVCSTLESTQMDNLCGRATHESIAMYIFAASVPYISEVNVSTSNISVTVTREDFLKIPYASYKNLQYGITSFLKGELDNAISLFSESIKEYNNNFQAYNLRGRAYRYKENYKDAETDFSTVISLAPNWSEGWRNKGNILLFQNKFDEMIMYFEKAVQLNSKSALAANNLGYALGLCKRYNEGLKFCKKAIELKPNYKEAYLDCAALYLALGDEKNAELYTTLGNKLEENDEHIYKLGDDEYEENIGGNSHL